VGFLILRAGVAAALGVFSNVVFAGGAAAMVGALVVFPSLVPNMIRGLRSKGVVTDAPVAPAPAQQVAAPGPAPVAVAGAPVPAAEAPAPVAQKKVVKKIVVKKENDNV
jgi:hypothetical protein